MRRVVSSYQAHFHPPLCCYCSSLGLHQWLFWSFLSCLFTRKKEIKIYFCSLNALFPDAWNKNAATIFLQFAPYNHKGDKNGPDIGLYTIFIILSWTTRVLIELVSIMSGDCVYSHYVVGFLATRSCAARSAPSSVRKISHQSVIKIGLWRLFRSYTSSYSCKITRLSASARSLR